MIVDLQSVGCFRCRDLQIWDQAVDVQSFDGQVFHEHATSQEIEERGWSTESVRYDLTHFIDDMFWWHGGRSSGGHC